jgi:putative SOS response-associated peptidase YedK
MPVILSDRESIETWLDTSSGEWSSSLAKLLKPFGLDDGLVSYPVPKEVGKVGNQSADFLKVSH